MPLHKHCLRHDIINYCCDLVEAKDYLEIGCSTNDCFDQINVKNKTGVDPDRGGTHRMTSDQYFEQHPTTKFDVIFIDGLHHYQQVMRDFDNSVLRLRPDGIILFHDMLPAKWEQAVVPRKKYPNTPAWNGDVWRTAFYIASLPDWEFYIADTDHGVGIARKGKNPNPIPWDNPGEFEYFLANKKHLPIVSADRLVDLLIK